MVFNVYNAVLSFLSVAVMKHPDTKQLWEGGGCLCQLTIPGGHSSLWGNQGKNFKKLDPVTFMIVRTQEDIYMLACLYSAVSPLF